LHKSIHFAFRTAEHRGLFSDEWVDQAQRLKLQRLKNINVQLAKGEQAHVCPRQIELSTFNVECWTVVFMKP
jgi:hypothetical protein